MKIRIAQRYRPYSHRPGAMVLIPGSSLYLQLFPTRWRLFHEGQRLLDEELPIKGPVSHFTILQDIEKGRVKLFGHSIDGYYGLTFTHVGRELQVTGPIKGQQTLYPVPVEGAFAPPQERLSLGCHKSQEFEKIQRRADLQEILPLWFHLGQSVPVMLEESSGGNFALLAECLKAAQAKESHALKSGWLNLFHSAFDSLFMPKKEDDRFLGLAESSGARGSPLTLLSDGYRHIRALFIRESGDECHFLPMALQNFVHGRMHLKMEACDCAFEWTKGKPRQLLLTGRRTQSLRLIFPSEIKECRLKRTRDEKGVPYQNGAELFVEPGKVFLLDRFQK